MNSRSLSHHEAWEAVPWILNGSLSEAEARAAQEHVEPFRVGFLPGALLARLPSAEVIDGLGR